MQFTNKMLFLHFKQKLELAYTNFPFSIDWILILWTQFPQQVTD
jgi:hypothetical protein